MKRRRKREKEIERMGEEERADGAEWATGGRRVVVLGYPSDH